MNEKSKNVPTVLFPDGLVNDAVVNRDGTYEVDSRSVPPWAPVDRDDASAAMVFLGGVTNDAIFNGQTSLSVYDDGAVVVTEDGRTYSIRLEQCAGDPFKRTSRDSLSKILSSGLEDELTVGGGAPRSIHAATVACPMDSPLVLLNEAGGTELLAEMRDTDRFVCVDLDYYEPPTNIAIEHWPNRFVIRESLHWTDAPNGKDRLEVVKQTAAKASAVVSVSSKHAPATLTLFKHANGARRFLQPTGSLDDDVYLELLPRATDVICNFAELMTVAELATAFQTHLTEDATDAPRLAAYAVRQLHSMGLAGEFSTIVTLGRRGVVAANCCGDRPKIWYLAFVPHSEHAVLPTPTGSGDSFLGAYVAYSRWAGPGSFLKEPVRASATRSMRFVARQMGLRDDSYSIDPISMSEQ